MRGKPLYLMVRGGFARGDQNKENVNEPRVRQGEDSVDELPERLISEHANLVTPEGLKQIEAEVRRFDAAHAAAQVGGDLALVAATARELRYWSARLGSAELVPAPATSTACSSVRQ